MLASSHEGDLRTIGSELPGVVIPDAGTAARLQRDSRQFLRMTASCIKRANHQLVFSHCHLAEYAEIRNIVRAPILNEAIGFKIAIEECPR